MDEFDEDLVNNPLTPSGSKEFESNDEDFFNEDLPDRNSVRARGDVSVGNTGLGDSQWDESMTLSQVESEGIDAARAQLQPWTDQLGNAIAQAVAGEIVGGSIEGVGYLLDWQGISNLISGEEEEYTNWLSDIGKSIRENTEEATRIYELNPGEMNLSDPGYWFKNSVSVASTLSMMIPSIAGARAAGFLGKGASKIAAKGISKAGKKLGKEIAEEAVDISKRMGVKADWATSGISQAVISRHIENSMEASGTFEERGRTPFFNIHSRLGTYTDTIWNGSNVLAISPALLITVVGNWFIHFFYNSK